MGFHTFPVERADALDDPARYRYCSREELIDMMDPSPDDLVADLGSGTGFYTADVAPFVGKVYAIDIQEAMHELHREHGIPSNTELVTSELSDIPIDNDQIDLAFSIMTHHEYVDDPTMIEIGRIIRPGGRLITVDWSKNGSGEEGPPLDERFTTKAVVEHLESAGFTIETTRTRPETMAVSAILSGE